MKPLLRIPKWRDFQHYGDRTAPWIKAYRELLHDDDWNDLADASKAHLFGLWLLAPSYEGKIPFKPEWISKQIGANAAINWRELAQSKFVELNDAASVVIAELYRDSSLRALARIEGDEEKEKEGDGATSAKKKTEVPEDYSPPVQLIERAVHELGLSRLDVLAAVPKFVGHHRAKGNTFKRHDQAFWNWISGRFVGGKTPPPPKTKTRVPQPPSEAERLFADMRKGGK